MNETKLDAMMEAMQQVEQDLRDYSWMAKRVARFKNIEEMKKEYPREVWEAVIGISTSKYGVEATLPKSTDISDPTAREAQKLLREYERIKRYEKKLKRIDEAVATITDERERAVAEAIMDGERLYMIAQQIGVSRTTVYELRKSVIRKLAIYLYKERFS